MATSIHIPDALLAEVDRRARALEISRNRFIVRVLEREIAARSQWSPGFLEALSEVDPKDAAALDEMLAAIEAGRRSKGPVDL